MPLALPVNAYASVKRRELSKSPLLSSTLAASYGSPYTYHCAVSRASSYLTRNVSRSNPEHWLGWSLTSLKPPIPQSAPLSASANPAPAQEPQHQTPPPNGMPLAQVGHIPVILANVAVPNPPLNPTLAPSLMGSLIGLPQLDDSEE
ncbi:hypothetical protein FRC08_003964 [Ceratobasidium sp. 394]|nr:hypothetical protein FRC08_003964 [Ceratobasidium sp. 394]